MQQINLYTNEFKTRGPVRLIRLIAASLLLALLIAVLIWALAPGAGAHSDSAWRAPELATAASGTTYFSVG